MRLVRGFGLMLFLGCSFILQAQSRSEQALRQLSWYHGFVITHDNQLMRGKVHYDPEKDLILMQREDKVKAFSAHQVHFFQYYDHDRSINRQYKALPPHADTQAFQFFEVVMRGKLPLLRRMTGYEWRRYDRYGNITITDQDVYEVYAYYVYQEEQLVPLDSFATLILPSMQDEPSVKEFIEDRRLDLFELSDQVALLDYYNQLEYE